MSRSNFGQQMTRSAMGQDVRATFITKTYLHLLGAIVLFMGVEAFLLGNQQAREMAMKVLQMPFGWIGVLVTFAILGNVFSSVAHNSRNKQSQYLALGAYAVFEAVIFLPLLIMAQNVAYQNGFAVNKLIIDAGLITLTAFIALTGVAFVTRKDFSFMRGMLMFGGIMAIVLIVVSLLFSMSLGIWFSGFMVLLAGGFILYETSNVIHHYGEESYVGAALQLFASVALMLWYVVRIVMSFASSD